MMISPKKDSKFSRLILRNKLSRIDFSRLLCTLSTYQSFGSSPAPVSVPGLSTEVLLPTIACVLKDDSTRIEDETRPPPPHPTDPLNSPRVARPVPISHRISSYDKKNNSPPTCPKTRRFPSDQSGSRNKPPKRPIPKSSTHVPKSGVATMQSRKDTTLLPGKTWSKSPQSSPGTTPACWPRKLYPSPLQLKSKTRQTAAS